MSENDNNSGEDSSNYETPATTAEEADTPSGPELAGRGARFGAYLVDVVISTIVFLVIIGFGWWITFDDLAQFGTQPSATDILRVASLYVVVFMAINGYLLVTRGQTVGKLMLGIRIVDAASNGAATALKVLGLRYVVVMVVTGIPNIGQLLGLIDVLFIFREDRRCVHDLLAGTKVVSNS